MKSSKLFVLAAIALSPSACGAVDYVKDKFEATELIQKGLGEQGWDDAHIGWNLSNGKLQNVSIQLDAEDVRSTNIGELEQVVQAAVAEHLKKEPDSRTISIVVEPINEPERKEQRSGRPTALSVNL